MPPRGVKKGSKRGRQYEHIKESLRDRGESEDTAEEIAARTVNKERARAGGGPGAVAALSIGHLVRPTRRDTKPSPRPARAHEEPAVRGGQGPQHPRPVEDDEGRVAARLGRPLTDATTAACMPEVRPRRM